MIQIKPHIFGSDRLKFFLNSRPNRTKLHVIFVLDRMTFCVKNDPIRTTTIPSSLYHT